MNKIILIALAALLIVGCSKKNNPTPQSTTTASITGKWYLTTDTLKVIQNGVLKQTSPTSSNRTDYLLFNADGTGSSSTNGNVTTFNYTVSAKTLTINTPAQTIAGFPIDASIEKATVRINTAANLVLYFDDTSTSGTITEEDTEVRYLLK